MANRFKDQDGQDYIETDGAFDDNEADDVKSDGQQPEDEQKPDDEQEKELTEEERLKLMLAERKQEIRNILLGNFVLYADGSYGAGNSIWVTPFGFGDGAGETIVFGISHRTFRYQSTFHNDIKTMYQVRKSMQDVGRKLNLLTAPEADTCYVKSVLFRPVVLSFDQEEDENGKTVFVLHAYTSRSLTSFLAVKRAVRRFDKALPKQVSREKSVEKGVAAR